MDDLTDSERRRFSAWLRQDAESNQGILSQLEKLPHAAPIVASKKAQVAACLIVARMLDDTETQSIGPAVK